MRMARKRKTSHYQPGKMHSQRDALGKALLALGKEYKQLVVLSPDVGTSTKAAEFGKKFPERYICTGIAEMNTVGIAAGLASMGFIPIVTGYAIFIAGKAWEPFRNSVAYPHLNVKMVGTHAGINVGEDGVTHQAIEDIALMRSIPGLEVYVPGDANQVLPALRRALKRNGPVYIRLEREPMPILFPADTHMEIKDYSTLIEGEEIAIMAVGGMVATVLEAAEILRETNDISAKVICAAVIKPINHQLLLEVLHGIKGVVTAEDHNMYGGFGSSIAEALTKLKPIPQEMVALRDTFACSGESKDLKDCYGLCVEDIVKAATRIKERISHEH